MRSADSPQRRSFCLHDQRAAGAFEADCQPGHHVMEHDGDGVEGMARLRAALVGATVRAHTKQRVAECYIETAQAPWEVAMQEAREVQEAMIAWRSRNNRAQATARLSATMTMAIVRRRRVWQMHEFWQAIAQQRCRNRSLMN